MELKNKRQKKFIDKKALHKIFDSDKMRLYVNEEKIKYMVFNALIKLAKSGKKIDLVIGIETGGYYLAKILYELLNSPTVKKELKNRYSVEYGDIEISSLRTKRYTIDNKAGEIKLIRDVGSEIKNRNVVVVDDVSDGGETLIFTKNLLRERNPSSLTFLTLHIKEGTKFIPDIYLEKVEKEVWIVYPWEKESLEKEFLNFLNKS